ncbi:hypothetical protein [Vibrio parahaemolyticus]|nr:hypothetical protein [Vibrio parahaemolyticus]
MRGFRQRKLGRLVTALSNNCKHYGVVHRHYQRALDLAIDEFRNTQAQCHGHSRTWEGGN